MPTNVVMPQMGESIFEGTITKWLKKVGETVEKDEPLFEISTDKVDVEIPAPIAGLLSQILVTEGSTVEINTVVAVIGGEIVLPEAQPVAEAEAPPAGAFSGSPDSAFFAPIDPNRRLRSSPLVRRIAKENGLDLRQVPGSGSEGRITKDDVLRFLSQPRSSTSPAMPDVQPLSKMRSIIAHRMVESLKISPHVHDVFKIDMTRVVRLRQREKVRFEQRHGIRLTFMPFIATAAIEALRKAPIVNASLIDGSIHYHRNIHLGIAVALEWGLIVPVVKNAEQVSFVELARSISDLAERARTKKLKPEEATGSTFTLTNSGVFGDEFGMPIINQPESAILDIGRLKKEVVVVTDAEDNDTLAIRSMQYYCIGMDHRIIDGADSGKFMTELKRVLENWDRPID
jgi:pyruvate dehydrogenase E2 component (dihydrolipoamide acetyltransferase)